MLEWVGAAVGIVAVGWYIVLTRRRRAAHALRGLPHLAEFADELDRVRAEVATRGVIDSSEALADGTRPPSLETSLGVILAWTTPRTIGGYRHWITLFCPLTDWPVAGIQLAYACERIGLPWDRVLLMRTTRGVWGLEVTLSPDEHAALLARPVEPPAEQDLASLLKTVGERVARAATPDYEPEPRIVDPSDPRGGFYGSHGIHFDRWNRGAATARLRKFRSSGSRYAAPLRGTYEASGFPGCRRAVHMGLYPKEPFRDVLDFSLFVSSDEDAVRRELAPGSPPIPDYAPPPEYRLLTAAAERVDALRAGPELPDIAHCLRQLELPAPMAWVHDLEFRSWHAVATTDGVALAAETMQGYLTIFTVDEAREPAFEHGDGCHGVAFGDWDRAHAAERLALFQRAGPEYALPTRSVRVERGIPRFPGNLYVALYPAESFEDLLDFELFGRFSSSIVQDLVTHGEIDLQWFIPQPPDELLDGREQAAAAGDRRPELPDLAAYLRKVGLPKEAEWVFELDFQSWIVDAWEDGIEMIAEAREGYLVLFTVDD